MLVKCSECGKDISDKAVSCPNCGLPINTSIKKIIDAKSVLKEAVAKAPIYLPRIRIIFKHLKKISLLLLTLILLSIPYAVLTKLSNDLNSLGFRVFVNFLVPFISWFPFSNVMKRLYGSKIKKPLSIIFAICALIGILSEYGNLKIAGLFRDGPNSLMMVLCLSAKVVSALLVFWFIRVDDQPERLDSTQIGAKS